MKRRLTLTYTQSETIEVDIPDATHTQSEIDEIIEKAAESYFPVGGPDDWETEWQGKPPIVKGQQPLPLPENWMEVCGLRVATNGHIILIEGCNVAFENTSHWRIPSPELIKSLEPMIQSVAIGPHQGYFKNAFKDFGAYKAMATKIGYGLTIETRLTHSLAQILENGKLIALIMPCTFGEDAFQFSREASRKPIEDRRHR